jgi:16S rRNA (guanine(527)-N(7))-methyltransferase RsmG
LASIIEQEFARLGLSISKDVREKLELYVQELERWNRTVNLTALQGAELVRRLVAEPAWIGKELQVSGNVVDVGSGNGCPGIPLYLTRGLKRVDLVEARARRAAFLRHMANKLGPDGIVVHRARLEDVQDLPRALDWITFQGVDPSKKLLQTLRMLGAPTTRVVWITSREIPAEVRASRISVPRSSTVAWVCGSVNQDRPSSRQ